MLFKCANNPKRSLGAYVLRDKRAVARSCRRLEDRTIFRKPTSKYRYELISLIEQKMMKPEPRLGMIREELLAWQKAKWPLMAAVRTLP